MTDIISQFLDINNFQRAWEKVAGNRGGAGIDGETIDSFASNQTVNIYQLLRAVANSTYEPQPYKQVVIPKKNGKQRELKIPTVRDRIVQQALLNVLNPVFEEKFLPVSFAYRPNLSYINAVEKIADWRDMGYVWVFDADIAKFFDNIDHFRLLKEVRLHIDNSGILCLIKSWISVGMLTLEGLILPQKGIPQGAVVSPLLANIYLHEFDELVSATDLKLVRYADDFVVLSHSQERILLAQLEIVNLLDSMGLTINTEKTQITNFNRGFRFLGHGFIENAIFPVDANTVKLKSGIEEKQVKKQTKKKQEEPQGYEQRELESQSLLQENQNEVGGVVSSNIAYLHQPYLAEVEIESSTNEQQDNENSLFQKNIWSQEMAAIYLIEQGTSIYKDYQRFIIHVSEKPKLEVPIREVQQIIVFGNIQLSTPVINACLEEQIPVLFLSQSGQYHGHLWSEESINFETHLIQIERRNDDYFQYNVSKAIVLGKLMNSKQLLMRFNRRRKIEDLEKAIYGINQDINAVEYVDNLDTLRGYEGIAAARYFPAFGKLITNSAFSFSQRFRQPPIDEVNSLLSFGYTLLFNNVLSFIIAEGISPYIGNFHYGEKCKPYLAFDLMEEFRSPIVDSLVLKVINNNEFKPNDFDLVASTGGVYLSQSARKVFLKQFESRMNEEVSHPDLISAATYRHVIQLQVRRYKRYLLSGTPYESFLRAA
ncbi:CRISPR-associated endonuclease Cas1 [Aetokthonos hydrillicola Thurmond2011]|uniref:CRISPR-associated endonuclease Cas1 n=1 Tax=Aetokthonos hydrillicola Thurmond2011 TaxID=2712845 RepID=A0AAP5I831_9CYAN|nr:CRISPR-associated endonuclease Cas1 [Aetokthonos hydrillicola]MBO3460373.1 CRISPR-associated endonuclease Cas1 [Aetokthonos hydrillicola CCALA 1050]MBW4584507.1 CRISPR-associated endonuclease Cas1 [Aetokthonos hydrillicola CCALA 1050]MDR9896470.1 CRISPR-associated endonuclease Cas1 [Aetokthonos hydrillicola Thurmond2011]